MAVTIKMESSLLPNPAVSKADSKDSTKQLALEVWFSSQTALYLFLLFLSFSVVSLTVVHLVNSLPGRARGESTCHGLLNDGFWLNSAVSQYTRWQPLTCSMLHYSPADIHKCASRRRVVVIGDSTARALYNGIGRSLDFYTAGHGDHSYSDAPIEFKWDPFFNHTDLVQFSDRDSVVVVSFGYWYMKHFENDGHTHLYSAAVQRVFDQLVNLDNWASIVYLVPLAQVDADKLSPGRRALTNTNVDHYNEILHRAFLQQESYTSDIDTKLQVRVAASISALFSSALPSSFDGLHHANSTNSEASNIVFNHACNQDVVSDMSRQKTTCCVEYTYPNWKQIFVWVLAVVVGPFLACIHSLSVFRPFAKIATKILAVDSQMSLGLTVLFAYVLFALFADRTHLFIKHQKVFYPTFFYGSLGLMTVVGYLTRTKRKDTAFLNRHQTDEWKGWMQLVILIYHFSGASSISPVYNFLRVIVASYLFMTGYGHFAYFYRRRDFSFLRIAKVLIRLNLLVFILSFSMDVPVQAYYFAPLVSVWFMVVYVFMWIGNGFNENHWFMALKFILAFVVCHFMTTSAPFFDMLHEFWADVSGASIDVREWMFRIGLDRYITLFGCLVSWISVVWGDRLGLWIDSHRPSSVYLVSGVGTVFVIIAAVFEGSFDKYSYNKLHPYISFIGVSGYIILRNLTTGLRGTTSTFFAFFGRISLETFILQFHIWLAMDTRGILVVFPNSYLLNVTITSFMFVFVSASTAAVTNELTAQLTSNKNSMLSKAMVLMLLTITFNHI